MWGATGYNGSPSRRGLAPIRHIRSSSVRCDNSCFCDRLLTGVFTLHLKVFIFTYILVYLFSVLPTTLYRFSRLGFRYIAWQKYVSKYNLKVYVRYEIRNEEAKAHADLARADQSTRVPWVSPPFISPPKERAARVPVPYRQWRWFALSSVVLGPWWRGGSRSLPAGGLCFFVFLWVFVRVCILLSKARRRRLLERGIRYSPPSPISWCV